MAATHNEQNVTVTINAASPAATVGPSLKTVGAAVALAIFLGAFGAHRFYLNRPLAPVMLGIGLIGALTWPVTVFPLHTISVVWALVDLASIRAWVGEANAETLGSGASVPPSQSEAKQIGDGLALRLLRAAEERGGKITVTQGVMDTSAGFDEVRECLREMVEQGYADVGNASDSGVVVYTFDEL
ncbi:TM2 domain-containing protein [Candidatus Palauibacter soopunensis]|uniref:TM2 domain-containing protein n=1 Tax=Candidatus Palauibacter soopunensis TaxID=3056739 RepID=UPI00238F3AA7|nr:TM2 domain-containing protein [Candidatus Palauibacter soopunensis]MDE2878382.1 TM2 domain-containing protein [Candidatus Palauibacter soopunensis]